MAGSDVHTPSQSVAEALRQFYVDDLVHSPAVLELLGATFGLERVLSGSDWPFPMGTDEPDKDRAAAQAATSELLTRPLETGPVSE